MLFDLTEVEQLVDQLQQAMGIAVDHLQVVGWCAVFQYLLQRSDNQRNGRTYLVGYHRKKVQSGLAYLCLFLFVQQLQFALVLSFGTFQSQLYIIVNRHNHQHQI